MVAPLAVLAITEEFEEGGLVNNSISIDPFFYWSIFLHFWAFEELQTNAKRDWIAMQFFWNIDSNMIKVNKDLTMRKVHDEYKFKLQMNKCFIWPSTKLYFTHILLSHGQSKALIAS